jgi:hypothetical protein
MGGRWALDGTSLPVYPFTNTPASARSFLTAAGRC